MAAKKKSVKVIKQNKQPSIYEESLRMHAMGRPGKIEITPTKPLATQRDLSLAYSPGVAAPCEEIAADENTVYDYTAKGNLVAVISNGTAVLGLGNLGAAASKPVMEGKAVLFKRFADIDGIDLEVNTEKVDEFVNCVKFLTKSFGGVNLEDIAAPECFMIEQILREEMDIPVFHDDQHGTAIITAAGILNALDITKRNIKKIKIVVNGAGAAAIACTELLKKMGVPHNNVIMCDRTGVIYKGRKESMNQWKSAHAAETKDRTLADAMKGADVFLGLSAKDAVDQKMVKSMAKNPIIFACANPDPEIRPELVKEVRKDAIMATGRSDYPNQVNNVLGFPYIFRGALDVRATTINEEMKIAAAKALAALAREDVPDEVDQAYGKRLQYGPEYLIPVPFDPRLIYTIPPAVAKAAMDSGVARKPIENMEEYKQQLRARLDPTGDMLQMIFERIKQNPKRVVFAEGEEEKVIRAAYNFKNSGYGEPILVGRENIIQAKMKELGLNHGTTLEIQNAKISHNNKKYIDQLYARLQRDGTLHRDAQRLIHHDRNVFAAMMVENGDADAMITGLTRGYGVSFEDITKVINPSAGKTLLGLKMLMARERTVFVSDTNIHELPDPETLADIAIQSANFARQMGHEPRVAMISFSNFGYPARVRAQRIKDAVKILEQRKPDFEFDGEMSADIALNYNLMKKHYPFCRLTGPANVLVMPALHTASASTKLMQALGGATVVGPLLLGLSKPAQIVSMGATTSDIITTAAMAAYDAILQEQRNTPKKPVKKKRK